MPVCIFITAFHYSCCKPVVNYYTYKGNVTVQYKFNSNFHVYSLGEDTPWVISPLTAGACNHTPPKKHAVGGVRQ